jgi:hypothetical protein
MDLPFAWAHKRYESVGVMSESKILNDLTAQKNETGRGHQMEMKN